MFLGVKRIMGFGLFAFLGSLVWDLLCPDCRMAVQTSLESLCSRVYASLSDLSGAKAYLQTSISKLEGYIPSVNWEAAGKLVASLLQKIHFLVTDAPC